MRKRSWFGLALGLALMTSAAVASDGYTSVKVPVVPLNGTLEDVKLVRGEVIFAIAGRNRSRQIVVPLKYLHVHAEAIHARLKDEFGFKYPEPLSFSELVTWIERWLGNLPPAGRCSSGFEVSQVILEYEGKVTLFAGHCIGADPHDPEQQFEAGFSSSLLFRNLTKEELARMKEQK